MYKILLDGEVFYDPRLPNYVLTNLTCELEVNKTGTLKMTIPTSHPKMDALQKMYSELSLYQDDDWIYTGRVLSDKRDFYGNRTVECEGELSYLLDSIQRYYEYHDISVEGYFTDLIDNHNADVEERKRCIVGQVTVTDPNDSLHRFSTYENTWRTIEDRLISRLGGYVRIRHEEGKVAHHGSKYSTPQEFLDFLRPEISVISCGKDNWYGHPHAALLRRLMKVNTEILRTDECGEVSVWTDGERYRVGTFVRASRR